MVILAQAVGAQGSITVTSFSAAGANVVPDGSGVQMASLTANLQLTFETFEDHTGIIGPMPKARGYSLIASQPVVETSVRPASVVVSLHLVAAPYYSSAQLIPVVTVTQVSSCEY